MKNQLKGPVGFFFLFLLFSMIHLPFVFGKPKNELYLNTSISAVYSDSLVCSTPIVSNARLTYEKLALNEIGLSEEAFEFAMKGYEYLKEKGKILNEGIISIADFTKPSSEKRLFIVDIKNLRVLFNTYVAHGQGSGNEFAKTFSNTPQSLQSSLGFFVTSDTYSGKHGYSLHLNGMEKGFNDRAEERAIVVHGADYVHENYIRNKGFIGRSWGCPAVPEKLTKPIIEKIKNGSCFFIYSDNTKYLAKSAIINS